MKKLLSSAGEFQAQRIFSLVLICAVIFVGINIYLKSTYESRVIAKLGSQFETGVVRSADVVVLGVNYNETTCGLSTTIKFTEYNTAGKKLPSKNFVFSGNVMKVQVMRIDLDGIKDKKYKAFKGKHIYIFNKIVTLDGGKMQEYEISGSFDIPEGYVMQNVKSEVQQKIWKEIWKYSLDKRNLEKTEIKDAVIQAAGVIFIPGIHYNIKVNQTGGLDINSFSKSEVI